MFLYTRKNKFNKHGLSAQAKIYKLLYPTPKQLQETQATKSKHYIIAKKKTKFDVIEYTGS